MSQASSDWILKVATLFRRPTATSDDMDLSDEEVDGDLALDLMLGLPTALFQEPSKPHNLENPTLVVELSCKKLKANSKRTRRPLQQTLLIHRTLSVAKSAKRQPSTRHALRRAHSTEEGFDGVTKPPKAICRPPSKSHLTIHHYNPLDDPQPIQPPRPVQVQAW
ncbi:hypothetical protein L0F63_005827 [Massospora cicadina]|nr:hypothetical protein L0F63_005827 [Massospora cicadina]